MPPRRAAVSKASKVVSTKAKSKPAATNFFEKPENTIAAALPPARVHPNGYHFPLLFEDKSQQDALLEWFKSVEDSRTMPWRKAWIDPSQQLGAANDTERALNKRAYEVWVSEVSKSG